MDIISYECAKKVNDILVNPVLRAAKDKNVKCYRYPVNESGEHATSPYLDDLGYYKDDEDVVVAPDWEDLRKCLYSLKPSCFILSEFEAIDNIDEFAYKLVDYIKIIKKRK